MNINIRNDVTRVQLGNVAEYDFEYEFSPDTPEEDASVYREFCDAYSAVAAFFTTDPNVVLLPRDAEDGRWWEAVQETLDWRHMERHVVKAGDRPLSTAISHDPLALSAVVRAEAVLPWGETSALRSLASVCPENFNLSLESGVVFDGDSKAEVPNIFAEVSDGTGSPVRLPLTHVCREDSEAISALREFGSRGRSVAVKTCHGSGGWGTTMVGPELLASRQACIRTFAGLRGTEPTYEKWPLVIQEVVPASSAIPPDLTADGEIASDGGVRIAGMATMLMRGPRYSGCLVSAGRLQATEPWSLLGEFTRGVGECLSRRGYRGWYDVDFIRSVTGAIYALEVNTRRTGPCVAYTVGSRLSELGSKMTCVAASEVIRLPRRVDEHDAFEAFHATRSRFPELVIIPTTFMATNSARPSIGIAVAGATDREAYQGLHQATDLLLGLMAADRTALARDRRTPGHLAKTT